MVVTAKKPPAIDAVKSLVRNAGLRCTTARLTVMQHLLDAHGPETHAEVSDALAHRGFDRATIYRNLTELTEANLVSRVELGDHVWRFELRRPGGGHGEDHPHFLCTNCGEVSCLDDVNVSITPKVPSRQGLLARRGPAGGGAKAPAARSKSGVAKPRGIGAVTEVLLTGRCENCG